MLSRLFKRSYKDQFTITFLDRGQRLVKMRVRKSRMLPKRSVGEVEIDGHVAFELHGSDPDMIMTCLVREAWNGGANHMHGGDGRRAVMAKHRGD